MGKGVKDNILAARLKPGQKNRILSGSERGRFMRKSRHDTVEIVTRDFVDGKWIERRKKEQIERNIWERER